MQQVFDQSASTALEHRRARGRLLQHQSGEVTFNFDCQLALHGRAPAMAAAVKRLLPDRLVFTMQGDGDLSAIGTTQTPLRFMAGFCSLVVPWW